MKCKAYISNHCEESMIAKEILDKEGYDVEYINITDSMENLKEFLQLRDKEPFFEEAKQNNRVGVPTLVFGDKEIFVDVESGVDVALIDPYFKK
ncbi:glutaredoxin [Peptoniphilus sp. KCTC 25270]|uniref:glutaredoxin domain-containing protein n=1 Tax=Peptoniphilus sp. KCTC 25270 TaxID=2897414 RepID=UPI001E340911|nr:glutaredoxin domain-containing protein [Peptoniphilus sp. KCTC 25270]MCD1147238.1 glutaredoxin [Peptoniphilus sp. KCTC 25270]